MAEQKTSDKLKDLKAQLRSLVVSNPAKMKVDNLRKDYKEFVGGNIPISDFGYGNLVRFIKEECGDVFQVEGDPFNPTLCPIITKEIEQLDRFISRQKTPLNKSHTVKRSRVIESKHNRENERPTNYNTDFQTNNRRNPTQYRNNEDTGRGSDRLHRRNGNYRGETSYGTDRANETDSESEPVYIRNASSYRGNNTYRENERYCRRSETSHREDTLHRASESLRRENSYREKEPTKTGIEPYTENNKQIHGNNPSSHERKNHNHYANIPLPGETVQKVSQKFSQKLIDNMRKLVDQFPEGLWSRLLLDEYFKLYNKTLNLTILDYNSVIALCRDMPETFHITRPQAAGDWKLFGWNADIPRIEAAEHVRKVDVMLADKEAEPENDYMGNDALPGIDYHPSLYPNNCMSWTEVLPVFEQQQMGTLEVHITEVRDPSHFWYNIRGPEHSDALDTLMDNLDNTYRITSLSDPLKMPRPIARIGQYCVSRYGDSFHRALIIADVDMETVKVRYVDYGTVHTVQANNLFHLLSKFAHFPQQGLRGRLMNLKPVLGAASWSQSARRRFLTLVKEKVLIGKIIKFDTEENVAVMGLVDTAGIKDIHINDVLYNERLADLIAEVEGKHNPDEEHPYLLPMFDDLENGRSKTFADLELIDRENLFEDFASKEKHISSAKQSVNSVASLHSAAFSDTASHGSDEMHSHLSDRASSTFSIPLTEEDNFPLQQPNMSNLQSSMIFENDSFVSNVNYNNSMVNPVDRYPPQFNSFIPQQNIQHPPLMSINPGFTNMNVMPQNVMPPPMFVQNSQNVGYNCYPPNIFPDQRVYYHTSNPHSNEMHFDRNFGRMPTIYNRNPYSPPVISRPPLPQEFPNDVTDIGNANMGNNHQLNNLTYPVNRNNGGFDRELHNPYTPNLPNKIENYPYQVGKKPHNNKNINNPLYVFEAGDENNHKNDFAHENITKTCDKNYENTLFEKYTEQKNDTNSVNVTKSFLKIEDNTSIKHNEQRHRSDRGLDPKTPEYIPFSVDVMRSSSPNLELKVEPVIEWRNDDGRPGSRVSELCKDIDDLIITPKAEIEKATPADKVTLVKVETILNRALEIWLWNTNEEPCVLLHQAAHQLLTSEGQCNFKNIIKESPSPSRLILANQHVTKSILSNLAADGLSGTLIGESISSDSQSRCNGQVLMFVPFKFFVATMRTYRPHLQVTIPELFMIAGSLTSSFKRL